MRLEDTPTDVLISRVTQGDLSPAELPYAAEELGTREPAPVDLLLGLLAHESSVVREGAVYGLADHQDRDDVAEALERVAKKDPSTGVRLAAADVLI
jgi:HEAT repeat protein